VATVRKLTNDGTYKFGFVTDGSQIYFSERSEGELVLSTVPAVGGQIRHLQTELTNPIPVDISADSRRLLVFTPDGVNTEVPLWIVPLVGQPTRTGEIRGHSAAWSPDGKQIAFAAGDSVFITSNEGRSSRSLGTFSRFPSELSWASDGRHLRFLTYGIHLDKYLPWEMTLDEEFRVRAVTQLSLPAECCGSWSKASSGHFFFSSDDHSSTVWAFPEKRGLLEEALTRIDLDALQSPLTIVAGGATLQFLAVSPTHTIAEVLRFDTSTKGFLPYAPNIQGLYLAFSPDGRNMCFVSRADGTLWVSRPDGRDQRQITFGKMIMELPRWSPDGRKIAYTAKLPGKPWRIFVIPSSGGEPEEASSGDDGQGAPTWSPDGKSLVYANVDCQEVDACFVHRISLAAKTEEALPHSKGYRTARWSPDGKFVAAMQPETKTLWLFDFRSATWRTVAEGANGDDISWSSDSQYIYYAHSGKNLRSIARFSLKTGSTETAVDLSIFDINQDLGNWFCLAPDNSIILIRELTASEIYAVNWSQH
jgi:Tol biopolymer transport system component